MPDPTPLDQLRKQIIDACHRNQHDDRTGLKVVLLALVDQIEKVSERIGQVEDDL